MLGFIFGFNARLGRMHFFLGTLVLAVAMTLICFAIAGYSFSTLPRGVHPSAEMLLTSWPVITACVLFAAASFMLQAMRFRDIGWDPVCVIPGWIAATIIDRIVALKMPALSIGHGHTETAVGALVNLALLLALLFWPGGEYEAPTPSFGEPSRKPDASSYRAGAAPVSADRLARATRGEFGRRAF
jgi:uncharacterized membrane protein YhaH (DUF805 family)